jgi:hypothetical protein
MGKKRSIALFILLVAVFGGLMWVVFQLHEPEPVYEGKPLDFWLAAYNSGNYNLTHPKGPPPPSRQEAGEAIHQMGTKAIPTMLRMLQQRDSKFKVTIMGLLQKQHLIKIPFVSFANQNLEAMEGLMSLGPEASNAVPRLIELFGNDSSLFHKQAVAVILGYIGPAAGQATPTLLRSIIHTNQFLRNNVIFALGQIHTESKLVVPALIKCLNDPDVLVRTQAAHALGEFGEDAQLAVPALIELFRKEPPKPASGLLITLGGVMTTSSWVTATVPSVAGIADVASATKEALQSIDPAAAAKAGVK